MNKEEYTPSIGKNVIETLTLGMYDDARFIYREYVQNAADQIDVAVEEGILETKSDGEISITIDKENKTIIVEDNATGIKSSNVLQFLGDVAKSQKDREKRKGFRGIGRLGGLGYCEKLIFETTYKEENVKSIITLNAKLLKDILEDKANTSDAAAVISVITTLDKPNAPKDDHYFKVKLINVTNDKLLDENNIRDYLSMVAPIPYSEKFPFQQKIHDYFNKYNIKIEEYDIHININKEKLYKPYKPEIFDKNNENISNILDVGFFNILGREEEIIAIGWYGISDLLNFQIPSNNIERGLRLRKSNIEIGNEYTLGRFFGQPRQNLNYIGEVHAISNWFIPNARRDYFNDNKTVYHFEKALRTFFSKLGTLTQESSKLHNRKKDIQIYRNELQIFNEKASNNKLTKREEDYYANKLRKLREKAKHSEKEILKIKKKTEEDKDLNTIHSNIIGDFQVEIEIESKLTFEKSNYPITLSRLSASEQKLVKEIFSILEDNLPLEQAEMLKKKIAERYN